MEQTPNLLRITNSFGRAVQFCIEPYGMIYNMDMGTTFIIVLRGTPEQNQFEVVIESDAISVYGERSTMSIFSENGIELIF